MKVKQALNDLVRAIVEEAERNPEFSRRVEQALGLQEKRKTAASRRAASACAGSVGPNRTGASRRRCAQGSAG